MNKFFLNFKMIESVMVRVLFYLLGRIRFHRFIDLICYLRVRAKLAHYRTMGLSINFINAGVQNFWIVGDVRKFKIDCTSHLKSGAYIECNGGVYIGKYFHVGRNLTIMSSDHDYKNSEAVPFDSNTIELEVVISDFVWAGADVTILPGVKIGEGAILGASTVVSKDVPPMAIVVGNPMRIIGYRDEVIFKKIRDENKFY